MNNFIKMLLVFITALYIVSPVDIAPGPVDDFIVLLLQFLAQKKLSSINK